MLDLAALVGPMEVDEFLREHWPTRPYWSSDGVERLAELSHIPELRSAEAIMAGATRVYFFRPDGGIAVVAPDEARKVHRLGLTCFLGCAHVPALMEIAEHVAAGLGLPTGSMTCEVFCSDGDSGAAMHSDHDVNFAVQVRGTKRWCIAENRHIRHQTALCMAGSDLQHDPLQLELADQLPFPDRMPDDAQTIDVAPGGLVFLPRGWWHETSSSGECLQVNFVFNAPMWRDVLVKALKRRLHRDVKWREYAYDLFGAPERRTRALETFAALLADLHDTLGADDLLEVAEELVSDAGLRPADGSGQRASS